MNKHLNIFTPFSERANENNLTRALAILLKKDLLFLSLFLEKIISNGLNEKLLNNEIEIEIDTQKESSKFDLNEGINKVYGVTLNTVRYYNKLELSKNINKPIPDLSIQIDEVLIIIEIKLTKEDPRKQLNNQINKLNWGKKEKNWTFKSLIWEEILNLTLNLEKINHKLNNINMFLYEFNQFIEGYYPELLPTSKISSNLSIERINQRIKQIEKDINIKIHGENFIEESSNFIKLKNCLFAERFKIFYSEDTKKINLGIWPGDNNTQGKFLYKKPFNLNKIKKNLENKLSYSMNFNISTNTYIKFYNSFGEGLHWEWIDNNDNISEIYQNIAGQIKKENLKNWEETKEKLINYVKNKDIFLEEFKTKFENTNRTLVNICVGNEIKLSFDIKYIEEIEKENKTVDIFLELHMEILNIIKNSN